jgi:hypothetical protein
MEKPPIHMIAHRVEQCCVAIAGVTAQGLALQVKTIVAHHPLKYKSFVLFDGVKLFWILSVIFGSSSGCVEVKSVSPL